MAEKPTPIKTFAGTADKVVKDGTIQITISNQVMKDYLAAQGITKEVRESIADTEKTSMEEGCKLLHDVIKSEKPEGGAVLRMGTGNNAIILTVRPEATNHIPGEKGGKTVTQKVYGQVGVRMVKTMPSSLEAKDGIVEQISKTCAAIYGKK